ncbi:ATP-dependent DNA helicase DDX31-like [Palaemon carinicauda]|uniref:ATP-dependent DNA helicase DDX31-like n=1 Tax=Palaemon carinicauda TaxID=392227 RepID=UPI0035B6842F
MYYGGGGKRQWFQQKHYAVWEGSVARSGTAISSDASPVQVLQDSMPLGGDKAVRYQHRHQSNSSPLMEKHADGSGGADSRENQHPPTTNANTQQQNNKIHAMSVPERLTTDRGNDMGIMESLREQQPSLDKCRQTIMLSATLSAGVEKLAGMSLFSPKIIDVSHDGEEEDEKLLSSEALATPENLSHHYILVPAKLKLVTLAAFVLSKCMYGDERKIIIFFATQDMVDYHTALFSQVLSRYWSDNKPKKEEKSSLTRRAERVLAGYEDESEDDSSTDDEDDVEEEVDEHEGAISFQKLHGNMTQEDRSSVFKTFKEASAGVLMCTDVAARGLDLPRVCWIVQFNAACSASDYVHRVGRTARVDAAGSALIFLAPAEATYIQMLESHKIILKEVTMQKVLGTLKFISSEAKSGHHALEESATGLQLRVENLLLADKHLHDLAKKAYVSFVRSYASYPKHLREMFNFKALHLGHYAKSMGLRDSPSALGASAAFRAKREIKEKREKKEKRIKIQRMRQIPGKIPKHAQVSEFDSGLDTIPKKDRKK